MSLKASMGHERVRIKMEATMDWALSTGLVLFLGGLELGSIPVTNLEYLMLRFFRKGLGRR